MNKHTFTRRRTRHRLRRAANHHRRRRRMLTRAQPPTSGAQPTPDLYISLSLAVYRARLCIRRTLLCCSICSAALLKRTSQTAAIVLTLFRFTNCVSVQKRPTSALARARSLARVCERAVVVARVST